AEILVARAATRLTCDRKPYGIRAEEGPHVPARTVVIATGAQYRKPALPNLGGFEGVGIYYNATFMEAQLCANEEVIVVGGGNSAGQAAVFLAQTARKVHVVVRGPCLAESMSRYLVRRIEESDTIDLRTQTEEVAMSGDGHLERGRRRDNRTGEESGHDIRHVFMMMGAMPNTGWLSGCVTVDEKGFIKTGPDLSAADLEAAHWPLVRHPYLLETSLPGV